VFKEKGGERGVKEKEVGSAGGFGSGSKLGDDASSKLEVENDVGTMVGQTPAGNTLGMSSYANVTSAPTISERFANTAYGSFWESGWLTPLLLTMLGTLRWNPDLNILKEDAGNVSVWVKLHGVPMTAFSKDGLSAIATKLGTPLTLDSYTYDMCIQS
ncbi:putative reverse transcriptase domain-containing protein, partial [Tanacetum coccineum]